MERYIEPIFNDKHYKGYIKIDDTKFDYELTFRIPITWILNIMKPTDDENEIRSIFQLIIKRKNKKIELTNKEYKFFFSMIIVPVIDFYNDQQILNSEKMMWLLLHGRNPTEELNISDQIGMTNSKSYYFLPETCEMLSAPKFGCNLI